MPYYPPPRDIDGLNVFYYIDPSIVMCTGINQEENNSVKGSTFTTTSPTAPPKTSLLQWVAVGKGGKVSSVRTVRSHVSKGYHQRKRDSQKADLEKLTWQRRVALRPNATLDVSPEPNADIESSERIEITEQDELLPLSVDIFQSPPSLSPTSIIQPHGNLIPYAWFEKDGPILYVNRSKWPFPQRLTVTGSDRKDLGDRSLTPRQSGWMPGIHSPDFTAVRGAVLDLKVLSWIGQSPECFQFRVDVIKWIQHQLEDSLMAISDRTLGSIMTFAMWTAGFSKVEEMINHMDAIQRIVSLRGGFEGFDDDGVMIAKLTLFDSMIAILTGETPRLPKVTYYVSSPISPARDLYMTHQESPLCGSGNFKSIICYHKDQAAIISLLNRMWILTRNFEFTYQTFDPSVEPLGPIVPFVERPQSDYNTALLTLPLLSRCTNTTHNHLLETLQSASLLYSRILTCPPIDFPSTQNEVVFQQLCTAFSKCSDDDFWISYPGILLWILLIGTASARGKTSSAFWMFYLSRTGNFSNAESWLTGTAAVRKFLDIQSWIRENRGL